MSQENDGDDLLNVLYNINTYNDVTKYNKLNSNLNL